MASPRPTKRRRTSGSGSGHIASPITPSSPDSEDQNNTSQESNKTTQDNSNTILTSALKVLHTEAEALSAIHNLYATDTKTQNALKSTVQTILTTQKSTNNSGKLITCGVGKSSYIAQKLTATCKSLGIASSFMHACEAAHGDLGDIKPQDILLFVSFSGKTPELLNLLPHIPESVKIIVMTSHLNRRDCMLIRDRDEEMGILLPAPIPEREEVSFGVSAPTTSTTVALAVADMLALTISNELHQGKTKEVFQRNHPGGAIGMNHREIEEVKKADLDVSIVELPSPSISAESED